MHNKYKLNIEYDNQNQNLFHQPHEIIQTVCLGVRLRIKITKEQQNTR